MLAIVPALLSIALAGVPGGALAAAEEPPGAGQPAPTGESGSTTSPPSSPFSSTPQRAAVSSLIGGETLGPGGSVALVGAGFSRLLAAYAQGLGEIDDLGAALSFDYLSSEMLLGAYWRELQARSGASALALRLRAGLYADFGATYAISENKSAVGAEAAPALAFSFPAASGLVTLAGEVPVIFTFTDGLGFVLAGEGSIAYEAPLQPDMTLGARFGGGYRLAFGPAPGGDGVGGRGLIELSLLFGYRFF